MRCPHALELRIKEPRLKHRWPCLQVPELQQALGLLASDEAEGKPRFSIPKMGEAEVTQTRANQSPFLYR